jgi:hypothetical protein
VIEDRQREFAWACGLFEGEGSISNPDTKHTGRAALRSRQLWLSTTDLDVLERFQGVMGGYIDDKPRIREPFKPLWRWQVTSWGEVAPLLRAMLPYLGERRRAAAEKLLAEPPVRRGRGSRTFEEAMA